MNILLNTLDDPIWQVLALVITLTAPLLIVAVRICDVRASEHEMRQNTLTILQVGLALFLLMSGVELALHLPDAVRRGPAALPCHLYQLRRLHLHRRSRRHPCQLPHRRLGPPVP